MKKVLEKLGKILMTLVYVTYYFVTPAFALNVHAYTNGEIVGDGTVSANNGKNPTDQGYINVTKTITHEEGDPEGVYTVNFNIKGTEYSSTHQVPSYTIFVLDASDSMNDRIGGWLSGTTRFAQAKAAIKAASSKLVENPNGKVALIEFGTDSDPDKIVGFKHGSLTDSDFKQSWGGTNYDAGLMNAKDLLNTIINEDGVKNIIFISDGEPTIGLVKHDDITNYNRWYQTNNYVYESYFDDYYYCTSDGQTYLNSNSESNPTVTGFSGHESGTYDPYRSTHTFNGITYQQNNTLEALKTILKGSNNDPHNNIYSFSYMVNDDDAKSILQEIATKDENGNARWKNVDANSIVTELDKIADEISKAAAGVDATLTDEVGADFSVINNGDFEVIEGDMSYSLDSIPTGDGENISFKIKINPYAATGEHDTNGSFDLKYKISESDTEYEHITTSESPKVYWIAPESKIKVNYYLDGTTNSISESVESPQKVVTNEDGTRNTYIAEAKDIYGYTLVKANTEVYDGNNLVPQKENETINYTTDEDGNATVLYYIDGTTVNYYYTKNDITINDSTAIDKDGDTDKKGLNSDFNYIIDYNIKVDDYIGKVGGNSDVQITVTDTLPFEIDEEESNLDGGTYSASNKTITWTIPETEITSEENSTIPFSKTIKIHYKNIDINTLKNNNDTLTNNVSATITKGTNTLKTSNASYSNTMAKGKVEVYHVDENGDLLIPNAEIINGYVDEEYTTSAKTNIVGYIWNGEVPSYNAGPITSTTKTVTYVYTKNKGIDSIKSESLTKTGPANIDNVNNAFKYAISYRAEIENYVGSATLIIKDTPQYKVDKTKLSEDLVAVYDEDTNTFTWTVNADGINGNRVVTFDKELEIYYVKDSIKSNTVKNTVTSELSFTGEEEKSNLSKEVTTTIPEGVVNVYYYFDNVEKENATLNGYVGNSYTTSSIPANTPTYGYTLTETVGPVSGSFAKNPIEVKFYYTKNDGTITDTLDKVITNEEEAKLSLDNAFKYTITYNATVSDFVGSATLTITDTPSSKVNKDLSNFDGGSYDESTNTITWTIPYTITEKTDIEVIKNIELVFIADEVSEPITNKVNTHLELENGSDSDKEKETDPTDVEKGKVEVKYVYNNEIIPGTEVEQVAYDYVGKSYTTSAKDIYGYTWDNIIPDNAEGKITKEDTLVEYNYTKNNGTIGNTTITKESDNKAKTINDEFKYTIKFNSKVDNFVGNGTVTFTDTLPYEIDEEASSLNGGRYNANNKTITWTENYTIPTTAKDNENDRIVSITKEFTVVYKGITSEGLTDEEIQNTTVVNTANAKIIAGASEKTTQDVTASNNLLYGTVTTHHTDEDGNTLAEDVVTYGFTKEAYSTTHLDNIYGYTWNGENPDKYLGDYTDKNINVTYVYVNKAGELTSEDITKTLTNEEEAKLSLDNPVNYNIHYSAEINEYVGSATLIIIDTPQYKVDKNRLSNELKEFYDEDTNTFTWTIVYDETTENGLINRTNRTITFDKNISVYFIADEVTGPINNHVDSKLTFGDTTSTDEADAKEVETDKGLVEVKYVYNGEIIPGTEVEEVTYDYIGKSYTTSARTDIYGYTWDNVTPDNANGKITKEDTLVVYNYTKNDGTITDTLNKEITNADEAVESLDNLYKYTITYNATVSDFVGNATLTITDTPSTRIIEQESELDGGSYDEASNTISWTIPYTITEETTITVTKNIELKYIADEVTGSITNKVNTHLELENGSNSDKETETKEVDPNKSNITEIYVYIGENSETEIAPKIGPTSDYVGKSYTTTNKTVYGYTHSNIENYTNKYLTEDTIIKHIYNKNAGNITDEETSKETNSVVDSINSEFNYTISYNATLNDYVGTATTTLIDYLPYKIDINKSNIADGKYNEEDKTITWVVDTNIAENNKNISITKEIKLFYIDITEKSVKNDLKVKTNYDNSVSNTDDNATTEIKSGKVIVHYIDIEGNKLLDDIILEDLVGKAYTTEEKEIGIYYLEEVKGYTEGTFTEEEQEVTYIYDLSGTGGDDIIPPQTGYEISSYPILMTILLLGMLLFKSKRFN